MAAPKRFSNSPTKRLPEALEPYRLLDESQTAALLSIPQSTLQNHRCNRRGLPYVKLGRTIRYALADVLAYLESHRINPGGAA